ncbi:ribonuclease H-like domain-containing protein [Tanacetum coccineum]
MLQKEKEDLKAKLEQFETSSKNITKLINSQISSKDKTGLGYGDQLNENGSSGSELFNSVFDSRSSDGDDNQTNDRFKKDNGYHDIPPPVTGNYMPLLADLCFAGLDDSVYRPSANKTSASVSQVETSITPPSNTSVEMPRVESVRPSGVIIEDWVSDDDEDIFQSEDSQTTVKPSFKKIKFTKARNEPVKSDKQAVKPRMVTNLLSNQSLIKDCDFHEKRMPKESILGKGSGRIPVSTAKQNVNTGTPKNRVNVSKSKINTFPKSHSLRKLVLFVEDDSKTGVRNKAYLLTIKILMEVFITLGGSTRGCILFTETECHILSPDFKLIDESQVLLRVPRQNNMYSFDLKNVVPSRDLTCLFAKATIDESKLWHRRLGHVNFKTMNKLVKGNLVRGLPSKTFENDHTCVA